MGLFKKSPARRLADADLRAARAIRDANADLERRAGITYQTEQSALLDRDVDETRAKAKGR